MAEIKLSDYIAKRLKEHGVEHFFMVSGGGAMHLNNSLGKVIPYTSCHHEQACAIAAEGYARVNQKLAVVNVTTGPGGLNTLNGLFGQWTDSVPVLYISGQVKTRTLMSSFPKLPLRQLGDQEVDIISTVKNLTKYSVCITEPNEIKYHLDRAIYEATTGRKGPVWLDIPIDIQAALINEDDLKEFNAPQEIKTESLISKTANDILTKLNASKHPLIIAGHGIRLAGVINQFKELVKQLQIPIVTTLNGFDILESDNPYYIGRIGTIGQRAGNFALQNADLILCLGTRNNIRQISYNWENFGKNAFKIIVDIDSAELEKPLIKPDMAVCADLKLLIPEILKQTSAQEQARDTFFVDFCQNLREKYSFENHPETTQTDKIEPYHFSYALSKQLKENDIVVMANATPTITIFQNAIVKTGQRYITNSGDASMGYGLPASIGASIESPKRNIICLEGDGSIMMNIQELQTVKHYNLPLKIFVIKNNGYSSIRQSQKNFFDGHMTGSGTDSGVSVPDFVEVGRAFGLKSFKISNPKTMEDDIKKVLNIEGAVLCEVETVQEYSFVPKLSSRQLPDGSMVSASLEDMYPFLDRKEFEEAILC